MSTFERIYQVDPDREFDFARENKDIALSDREYLKRIKHKTCSVDIGFVSKPEEETIDEKSQSKITKKKPKKNHSKRHKPAVESLQAEL